MQSWLRSTAINGASKASKSPRNATVMRSFQRNYSGMQLKVAHHFPVGLRVGMAMSVDEVQRGVVEKTFTRTCVKASISATGLFAERHSSLRLPQNRRDSCKLVVTERDTGMSWKTRKSKTAVPPEPAAWLVLGESNRLWEPGLFGDLPRGGLQNSLIWRPALSK